jgi:hypothetical protein
VSGLRASWEVERRQAGDLALGDDTVSYGRLLAIKKGVLLLTLTFDSNAVVRIPPDRILAVWRDEAPSAN